MNRRGFIKLVIGAIMGLLVGLKNKSRQTIDTEPGTLIWKHENGQTTRMTGNWYTLVGWKHIDFYQDWPGWSEQMATIATEYLSRPKGCYWERKWEE